MQHVPIGLARPLFLLLRGVLPLRRCVLLQLPLPLLRPKFAHALQVLGCRYAQLLLLCPCSTCRSRLIHHGRAEGQRPRPHGGGAPAAAACNARCEVPSPLQLFPPSASDQPEAPGFNARRPLAAAGALSRRQSRRLQWLRMHGCCRRA